MRLEKLIDCHNHLHSPESVSKLKENCDRAGVARANIVSLTSPECINENPAAFTAKHQHPDFFYIFCGLDHSAVRAKLDSGCLTLEEQVDRLIDAGTDGFKLIESKPDRYGLVGVPLDWEYYEPFFAKLESTGYPVLWHVADPEEFWNPATTPKWALERGWGYGPETIPSSVLDAQVQNVLKHHPDLRVIFPHFFFMSSDLKRAGELFDEFPGVHFDLAPGVEFLHNLSSDPGQSREFFERYSEHIVFGSDDFDRLTPEEARARVEILLRFLTTSDTFELPPEADFLLGYPEDGEFHGLELSEKALTNIRYRNFERLAGGSPRALNTNAAADECARLAELAERIGADASLARQAQQLLSA